ncbi:Calreticulin [Klebsormidium nitens]|uniref:Calreticulin n=1 Tax=Klebsormidium nitens TaxID=105231 RepID=A0A1Y1HUY0_KLENI|nr:Calreticulin [Klebsormidium nitens]|eukprot:GAQ80781.1 Calreticulin [Klebsormidium nitens]
MARSAALAVMLFASLCLLAGLVRADDAVADIKDKSVFVETFDDDWEGRWIPSNLDDYKGPWKYSKSKGHDDYGLLVTEKARKYGIAVDLPETVDLNDEDTVIQYEVRLQEGIECGGAYLKFLHPQEAGWTAADLKDNTGYSVMFGPDKCGSTNKVHFIVRVKNPVSGEYVEHHLNNPPFPINDKNTHVYTAVIKPKEEKVLILIDGEEKKSASFKEDFTPPFQPEEEIDDPEDTKPADWVDVAKIPDPEATKPEDWDEDAPLEIPDEDAEKPEGWLDDEPDQVDDPEASKPEDWDDDEDGEWEPAKVDNPKCEEAPGCGEWKRPTKRNPDYKGKWSAPLIDNPEYKGVWAPRKIPNPAFYEVESVALEPIAAVAIEIWTMNDGFLFDNILLGHDLGAAKAFAEATSGAKLAEEKAEEEKEKEVADEAAASGKVKNVVLQKVLETARQLADVEALASVKPYLTQALDLAEQNEMAALVSALALVAGIPFLLMFCLVGGKKKATKAAEGLKKKTDAATADDVAPAVAPEGKEKLQEAVKEVEEDEAPARRRTRREN